jgi:uncharacterized protein YecE (DUF72 family)
MSPSERAALKPAHVGCSGWNYREWRERFYPAKLPARSWLEFYGEHFQTVEVNATFYGLIGRDAVARWVEQTPRGFIFAVKASRYLTHVKRLSQIANGARTFYERLQPLSEADRLGPTLWQLPETFTRDDQRLRDALAQVPPGLHAFEFRHQSWFVPEVYALLREHGATLVIGDHPERPYQTTERTAPWRYVRLHHGKRGRRGNYSQRELETWAERLHEWRARDDLFVYFNNDWEAFAPRNAAWMCKRLASLARESRG